MGLINCPECQRPVSDKAAACPQCGYPLRETGPRGITGDPGYEYRSRAMLFGLPLVHIIYGPSWLTGLRPARGIVAIGFLALGGISLGLISVGGISLGLLFALGGMAGGGVAIGGVAAGYIALGGVAIGVYAIGGMSIGSHTIYNEPDIFQKIKSLFGL